jgi:photosystem II stability/assembly factor-like uncharacterized protein
VCSDRIIPREVIRDCVDPSIFALSRIYWGYMPYQRLLHVWCVLLILVAPLCASAQWNRVPLPPSGYVRGLARAGQSLVAWTSSVGVWKFDRTAQLWSEDNAGIADMNIMVVAGSDRYVVACGYGGTFIRGVDEQSYRSYPGAPKTLPADVVMSGDTITAAFGTSVYSIVLGPKQSSWKLVSTLPGSASYALARMDDDTWYASTDKGLYRSSSSTTMTWTAIPLPSEVGTYRVTDIGSYMNRLYINANGRLYVSVDHGETWQHLPTSSSKNTVTNIDVAPDGSIVTWYPDGFDAWISRTNGQTFEKVITPSEVPYIFGNRCFDAEGALWSTSVRGTWKHTSATQGQFVVDGLYASPVTIIGQSATDMLTFCETIGLLKVRNADQQHTLFSEDEPLLRATSVTIASNGVGAITSLFPIYVTTDSGRTFQKATDAPNQLMAARVTNGGTVLGACSDGRVYEFSGSDWVRRTDSCPEVLNGITVDEHGTIYGVSHNRLYRWTVAEKTWTVLQYSIAPHWFTGIEQAPDGRVYLCTTSGLHIFDTTTLTGAPIGYPMTNVTMSAIAFIDATHIVAAGWGRLFYTSNNGQSWKNATDDLPVRYVNSIAVTNDGRITIGTNGGMYTRSIRDLATSVNDEPVANDDNVFPNPVSRSAMVHISVSTPTIDAVRIVDMNGQTIRDVPPTLTTPHHLLMKTDGLSAGTYVVIIQSGTCIEHRRIAVY